MSAAVTIRIDVGAGAGVSLNGVSAASEAPAPVPLDQLGGDQAAQAAVGAGDAGPPPLPLEALDRERSTGSTGEATRSGRDAAAPLTAEEMRQAAFGDPGAAGPMPREDADSSVGTPSAGGEAGEAPAPVPLDELPSPAPPSRSKKR
jgi:hypothetical protein